MKKLILTLVFVFAIGSFTQVNASTNEVLINSCAARAWASADALNASYIAGGGPGYSDWDMWELTDYFYEQCMGGTE